MVAPILHAACMLPSFDRSAHELDSDRLWSIVSAALRTLTCSSQPVEWLMVSSWRKCVVLRSITANLSVENMIQGCPSKGNSLCYHCCIDALRWLAGLVVLPSSASAQIPTWLVFATAMTRTPRDLSSGGAV